MNLFLVEIATQREELLDTEQTLYKLDIYIFYHILYNEIVVFEKVIVVVVPQLHIADIANNPVMFCKFNINEYVQVLLYEPLLRNGL